MESMKKAVIAAIIGLSIVCTAYLVLAWLGACGFAGLIAVVSGHIAGINGGLSEELGGFLKTFMTIMFGLTVILIGQTHGGHPPFPTNKLMILADGENLVFRCQALLHAGKKLDHRQYIFPTSFCGTEAFLLGSLQAR